MEFVIQSRQTGPRFPLAEVWVLGVLTNHFFFKWIEAHNKYYTIVNHVTLRASWMDFILKKEYGLTMGVGEDMG